ncbi:hypothetical protein Tco_0108058, partial [Tanacetum coccineum]
MKNPNLLNEPYESIPEENIVISNPNEVVNVHDPNEMADIPDNVDLVDYDGDDEENPEEYPEEDPDEDPKKEPEPNNGLVNQFAPHVDPHQPSEDEEVDVAPEATAGTITKSLIIKSGKKRKLLNHDLKNVERALGNVLERISVLESGENATLKKRLAETETKLEWARMERDMAEKRLHVSQGWNKRF